MSGTPKTPSAATTQSSVKLKISLICFVIVLLFMTLNISFLLRTESAFITALTAGDNNRSLDLEPEPSFNQEEGSGQVKKLMALQVLISLITGGAMIVFLIYLIGKAVAPFKETDKGSALPDSIHEESMNSDRLAARVSRIGQDMGGICSDLEKLVIAKNDVQGSLIKMKEAMGGIYRNTAEVCRILSDANHRIKTDSERMDQMITAAQKASNLMALITQISQQIDLLALNASIEIDRAGEEGENFMALLEQIKKLAWDAAEEVEEINSNINEAQALTTDTISEIGLTRQVISKAHLILSNIDTGIQKQSENILEITTKTQELFSKLDDISEKMNRNRDAFSALEKELHR